MRNASSTSVLHHTPCASPSSGLVAWPVSQTPQHRRSSTETDSSQRRMRARGAQTGFALGTASGGRNCAASPLCVPIM
eukprot:5123806-Pleurochrysis_carterae.AAC.1